MIRLYKPAYEKTCNWCKYLSMSHTGTCLVSGETDIEITAEVLDNKSCEHFKCCDCHRTLKDIIVDFVSKHS